MEAAVLYRRKLILSAQWGMCMHVHYGLQITNTVFYAVFFYDSDVLGVIKRGFFYVFGVER